MAIPTIEQVEESGANMDTITEEVKSSAHTLVDQYGDTRKTMAGRQADADEATRNVGGIDVGDYSSDPLITKSYEYVVYDRSGTPSNWKVKAGVSLDYQIDSTTYPTPQQDPNLQAFDDLNKDQADGYYTKRFAGVQLMKDYTEHALGNKYTTGATVWRVIGTPSPKAIDLGSGLHALHLNGLWVDDFIDDRSVDSSVQWNEALSLSNTVRGTEGDYFVHDIAIVNGMNVRGSKDMVMICNEEGGQCFLADTSAGGKSYFTLEGFSAKAGSGISGTALIRATNTDRYVSFGRFKDLWTSGSLETTYDGFFIYCEWHGCFDGEDPAGGSLTTHQTIKSIPDNHGTSGNDTNLNQVNNCQFRGATHPDGSVSLQYGRVWSFVNTGFEGSDTRALTARGVHGIKFDSCWFEKVRGADIIYIEQTNDPQQKASSPVSFVNCNADFVATNERLLANLNSTTYSVREFTFTNVAVPGQEFAFDETVCLHMEGVGVLSGGVSTEDFIDGTLLVDEGITHRSIKVGAPSGSANTNVRGDGFRHGRGVINATDFYELPVASSGGTFLILTSNQYAAGTSTRSAVYMLRMNADLTAIAATVEVSNSNAMTATFSVVDGMLRVSGLPASGANKVGVMACVSG